MKPLKSIADLHEQRTELAGRAHAEVTIRVCSTGCRALGALELCDALEREVAQRGLDDRVRVVRVGCHGLCAGAVAVLIDPKGISYQGVTADDAAEIIESTVLGDETIPRLCFSQDDEVLPDYGDIPFYKNQTRRVLAGCGLVDPRSLDDAIAHGAYAALGKALTEMSGEQVISEVLDSGLRGRGGAGFPAGRKWQFARGAPGEPKYIVCNADEGDPGAFMDRALLEGDPHLVIEGMIIGAYAIGANTGFIYVRAEYPIAIEHTLLALDQATEAGLLGENILGSGFSFDLEVRKGAGAFVCGEETRVGCPTPAHRFRPSRD